MAVRDAAAPVAAAVAPHAVPQPVPPPGLPQCSALESDQVGACYDPAGSRGFAVYTAFRGCFESWISPPGFQLMPEWLLAVLYLVATIWLFLGVAIAADIFMDSIMVITSATRPVWARDPVTGKRTIVGHTKVWHWVVSCLTLMALGSSAPEILLAVIETLTSLGQPAGQLGPAVVVGAAAFNVFNITLACTLALPTGTTKRISQYPVFLVTAAFALFAYAWLAIVLGVLSPGVITIWESLITLALFPLLVVCAWATDRISHWHAARQAAQQATAAAAATASGDAEATAGQPDGAALVAAAGSHTDRAGSGHSATPAAPVHHSAPSAVLAARRYTSAVASRLALFEARAGHDDAVERTRDSLAVLAIAPDATTGGGITAGALGGLPDADVRTLLGIRHGLAAPLAQVRAASYAVRPGGEVRIAVVRRGGALGAAHGVAGGGRAGAQQAGAAAQQPWLRVRFATEDADAVGGVHYVLRRGSVLIPPAQSEADIALRTKQRAASRRWPDGSDGTGGGDGVRSFFLRILAIEARATPPPRHEEGGEEEEEEEEEEDDEEEDGVGWTPTAMPADDAIRVDIVPPGSEAPDTKAPAGIIGWERGGIELRGAWEAAAAARGGAPPQHLTVDAVIERSGIAAGPACYERACAVRYSTRDGSALAGRDYRAAAGEVAFRPGETSHVVRVRLLPPPPPEDEEAAEAGGEGAGEARGGEGGGAGRDSAAPDPELGGKQGHGAAAAAAASIKPKASGSRTFSLVLSEPSGGCAVARGPGGAVLRITVIPEGGPLAGERRGGGVAGGDMMVGREGSGLRRAASSISAALAAAAPSGGRGGCGGGCCGGYPLRQRWLRQFRDAICYPPPPAIDADDDGGSAGGGDTVNKDSAAAVTGASALPPLSGAAAVVAKPAGDDSGADADPLEPPEPEGPTRLGLAGHLLTVVFKFLLATIPPADWAGGYPAFLGSLVWIGAFIAVIEQTATLFGCAVHLPQLVVGIVVVAAGTTVPDTWASIVAARHDSDADAAIANAFGSCAVNVYLGLGLPWTIASIYNAARGQPFEAPAGDLAFSVALYCGLAGAAVALLFLKRTFRGGELGGPTAADKYISAATLFAFWLVYVVWSAVRAVTLGTDRASPAATRR